MTHQYNNTEGKTNSGLKWIINRKLGEIEQD